MRKLISLASTCCLVMFLSSCVTGGYSKKYLNRSMEFVDVVPIKSTLPVDPKYFHTDRFYALKQYTDITKSRATNIRVFALGLNSNLSENPTVSEILLEKSKAQIISFFKHKSVRNRWTPIISLTNQRNIRLAWDTSKQFIPAWSYKKVSNLQKSLTKSIPSRQCYRHFNEPKLRAAKIRNTGLYKNTLPGIVDGHAIRVSLNIRSDKLVNLKSLLILPVGILSTKENWSNVGRNRVTRTGKFDGFDDLAQKEIGKLVQKYLGKTYYNKSIKGVYEKKYHDYVNHIGKVSLGQLFNPFKGEAPISVFRKSWVESGNLELISGLVHSYVGRTRDVNVSDREKDLLYYHVLVYDGRQIPKRNLLSGGAFGSFSKESGADDWPALSLSVPIGIAQSQSTRSFFKKNRKKIISSAEDALACVFSFHDISPSKLKKSSLEKYDDLGKNFKW